MKGAHIQVLTKELKKGTYYLDIQADDQWTIDITSIKLFPFNANTLGPKMCSP